MYLSRYMIPLIHYIPSLFILSIVIAIAIVELTQDLRRAVRPEGLEGLTPASE